MASSGTFTNTFRSGYAIRINWTLGTQNISNNTSNITANVQLVSLGSTYNIISSATKYGSLTINGTTYNFTFSANLPGGTTRTIYTKTVSVNHNADGTKTVPISCSAGIQVTLTGVYWNTVTASGNAILNTIPRSSTISTLTSSVAINGTNTVGIGINRNSPSFTHTVRIILGAYSQTITGVTTATTYAIPLTWLNAMPNVTRATATVQLTTFNGNTQIGATTSRTFTVTVPSTVIPTIPSVGFVEATAGIAAQFGGFVQNKSRLTGTIAASGDYGSTIKSIKTTINGVIYNGQLFTSEVITTSGTLNISITVTDSRGRTATTSRTRTIIPYSAPTINSFRCVRCTSDGTESNDGTYLKATIDFAIASVNNRNTKSWTLKYKLQDASTWTTVTSGSVYSYNSSYVSTSAILNADYAYTVMLDISDFFGTSNKTVDIGTSFALMDFNVSGRGIAFGKASTKNALEVNMNIYDYTDTIIRNGIAYYEANGIADPDTTTETLILTSNNTPVNGGFYYIQTFFFQNRNGNRSQIAIPYNQASGIYYRFCFNGEWSIWHN